MTDLTPSRLRELLAAATPGDWRAVLSTRKCGPYVTWGGRGDICDLYVMADDPVLHQPECADANAALIALAPALAARVIEQDAEIARLRGALEPFAAYAAHALDFDVPAAVLADPQTPVLGYRGDEGFLHGEVTVGDLIRARAAWKGGE